MEKKANKEDVIELYKKGLTYEDIGKQLHIHCTRVGVIVREAIEAGELTKRKAKRNNFVAHKVVKTKVEWHEKGVKCTCKTSKRCVYGFCNPTVNGAKCDFICRENYSRPKAEDGLCHVYSWITKDNPRKVEKEWKIK